MSAAFDWSRAGATPCTLLEADYWDGASVKTLRVASMPFVSAAGDTPAHTAYDDRLMREPDLEQAISSALTGARRLSIFEAVLDNADGLYDDLIFADFVSRDVRVLVGDASWPRSQFFLVARGASAGHSAVGNELRINITERASALDKPLLTALVASGPNANAPLPLAIGKVRNIPATLINPDQRTYAVSATGVTQITAVYDSGVAVAFTPNVGVGMFNLAQNPEGAVTADVVGSNAYGDRPVAIARALAGAVGYVAADFHDASLDALAAQSNQQLGLFIQSQMTARQAIDLIFASVGAWWSHTADGRLTAGSVFYLPTLPDLTLTDDDVEFSTFSLRATLFPYRRVAIGYDRNWLPLTPGTTAAAYATRDTMTLSSKTASASNAGVEVTYPAAGDAPLADTLLTTGADASAEATKRAAFYAVPRLICSARVVGIRPEISAGASIELRHPRYGLAAGRRGVLLRKRVLLGELVEELEILL